MIKAYMELCEKLEKELQTINNNALTSANIERLEMITGSMKNLKKIMKMEGESESMRGNGRYSYYGNGYYDDMSGRRNRSYDDGMYSYDDGREMMRNRMDSYEDGYRSNR